MDNQESEVREGTVVQSQTTEAELKKELERQRGTRIKETVLSLRAEALRYATTRSMTVSKEWTESGPRDVLSVWCLGTNTRRNKEGLHRSRPSETTGGSFTAVLGVANIHNYMSDLSFQIL